MDVGLYGLLAKYYDMIYADKDYASEVEVLRRIMRDYQISEGSRLLDVACGTGGHLVHLEAAYKCVGMDLSLYMLQVAQRKLPGLTFHKGNMQGFTLNQEGKFDVLTCMFSSIGYLPGLRELRTACWYFAEHLRSGGVIMINPWIQESDFVEGDFRQFTYKDPRIGIMRTSYGRKGVGRSAIEYHYIIAQRGVGVRMVSETHKMSFFKHEEVIRALRDADFSDVEFLPDIIPRGLYVGVRN